VTKSFFLSSLSLLLASACLLGMAGTASAGLIGQNVTVEFDLPGWVENYADTVLVTATPPPEIVGEDGVTNIGDSGWLFDTEYIDLDDLAITMGFDGGGDEVPSAGSYYDLGFEDPDATLTFSIPSADLVDLVVTITNAAGGVADVVNADVGPGEEIAFTPGAIVFAVGALGLADGQEPVTVRFDLTFAGNGEPGDVIPEPASMALLGLGIAAIARRRRK